MLLSIVICPPSFSRLFQIEHRDEVSLTEQGRN
jgi:hypothetical protein